MVRSENHISATTNLSILLLEIQYTYNQINVSRNVYIQENYFFPHQTITLNPRKPKSLHTYTLHKSYRAAMVLTAIISISNRRIETFFWLESFNEICNFFVLQKKTRNRKVHSFLEKGIFTLLYILF